MRRASGEGRVRIGGQGPLDEGFQFQGGGLGIDVGARDMFVSFGVLGLALLYLGIAGSQGYVQANYVLYLALSAPSSYEWKLLGSILAAAVAMGSVPAWRAYRQSLADGLSIRL